MSIHLLPNGLSSEERLVEILSPQVGQIISQIDALVCESEKGARAYLSSFLLREKWKKIPLFLLNEHTTEKELSELFTTILQGKKCWGILSDTGLASISDPASRLVFLLRKKNFPIFTYAGPCAPIFALMLCGFSGESFTYHGYLPRKEEELFQALKQIEREAHQQQRVQIWMDAPYRTPKMIQACLSLFYPSRWFGVAANLNSKQQKILSLPVQAWKKQSLTLGKVPAVFLLAP